MSKAKFRVAAVLSLLAGIAAMPIYLYLVLPIAQAVGATELPDGKRVLLSPMTGLWVLPVGMAVAITFFGFAIYFFWRSLKYRS